MAPSLSDILDKMSDRMTDHRVTVRLPADLHRRLKTAAVKQGTPESEIIRVAIERQFASQDSQATAYDLAKKAGLIGAIRGLSPDLSTNSKHFKDFGKS